MGFCRSKVSWRLIPCCKVTSSFALGRKFPATFWAWPCKVATANIIVITIFLIVVIVLILSLIQYGLIKKRITSLVAPISIINEVDY